MKGITGVPVTINSITVPTVANQNPMYGMAVNAGLWSDNAHIRR